jgi:hypothetical protein
MPFQVWKNLLLTTERNIQKDKEHPDMTSSPTKSILAVDDESAILDIIKHSLQTQEFKVCYLYRSIQSFIPFPTTFRMFLVFCIMLY